jgi:tetratricopeptide (TPR) repeat protein
VKIKGEMVSSMFFPRLANLILGLMLGFSLLVNAQEAERLFKQGEIKLNNGEIDQAMELFNASIAADNNYLNAYLKRAHIFVVKKDYESAVNDYTVILKNNPKEVFSLISRGSAYNKLGRYQDAMVDFNQAIEVDAKNEEAYNNRGWSKKFLGDLKGACEDWNKSKKLGNDEAKIILNNNKCK